MANKFWTPSPPKPDPKAVLYFALSGVIFGAIWGVIQVVKWWWEFPGITSSRAISLTVAPMIICGLLAAIVGIINSVVVPTIRSRRRTKRQI